MPDILLIQPPIRDFYLTLKRTTPYGLAGIAAVLLQKGFSVEILDALATRRVKNIELPPVLNYLKTFYPPPGSFVNIFLKKNQRKMNIFPDIKSKKEETLISLFPLP
mgnify:CR=1 FL=1